MPYKSPEAKREALKSWRAKQREVPDEVPPQNEVPEGEVPALSEVPLKSPSEVLKSPESLKRFLSAPCPGMPRLERLQRIAGSLQAISPKSVVFMGNLTVKEIGKAIGVLPPLYPRS